MSTSLPDDQRDLWDLARLFLKLGFTAFGGPAAHIAMMRKEVVEKRQWFDEESFLDLIGASNLIPGPTSTEIAFYIGLRRAGWLGLLITSTCFILPAAGMVLAFAWAYVQFGATPQAAGLLYGIKAAVVAIIVEALWKLGRKALKGRLLICVGLVVLGLYLAGINVLVLLLGGGLFVVAVRWRTLPKRLNGIPLLAILPAVAVAEPFSLLGLFLTFLKIGGVLYGGGYVLLAFLRADFVDRLGWLTDKQLLDAVAVGQFTPGPVFTTATFVGYLTGGWAGAIVATIGIFLPSLIYVSVLSPYLDQLRKRQWTSDLLDGVNVAALALMAGVGWELARSAVFDLFTGVVSFVCAVLLLRFQVNSAWLLAGAGVAGILVGVGLN
ncbi:MAG: chromate efflux transporter [Anaerolineae bacterium]|nr:chromate efflux transporter [Gloeobacterales cyanobacterium ES-bin-313]